MVYESDLDGTLEILAAEGETLAVGEVIAHIGAPSPPLAVAQPPEADGEENKEDEDESHTAPAPQAAAQAPTRAPGERVKASPLARRIATEQGVDLQSIAGSGP